MQSSQVKGISCLIDTDIAIDYLRRRDYAQKLLDYWAGEGLLAISTLTHLEIYQGMKTSEEGATMPSSTASSRLLLTYQLHGGQAACWVSFARKG